MNMNPRSFDHIPVGLCVLSADDGASTCLYVNEAFKGFAPLSNPVGDTLGKIWPCDEIFALGEKLMSGEIPERFTAPFIRLGQKRTAQITLSKDIFDGRACYALWVADGGNAQAETDRATKSSAGDFIHAGQSSGFLATISHEIRSPMQTVFGLLEMIEIEKSLPEAVAMATTAKEAANGLLEILDDVLDFAKMDADQMELDRFEVPLRTLIRGVLEAMSVMTNGKNILLKDDIAADVPLVIAGDPKRIRQILINLAGNAIKFTREGHVTIRVSKGGTAIPQPDSGFVLRFEVTDTGVGMARDVAERLFRPFTQGKNSTSNNYGGTGLGLSICWKLVGMMGGRIDVDTAQGAGSTFWFEIPVHEIKLDTALPSLPSLDGISVLSVEDHPLGAREIVKSLRSMGASVESCATVSEALDLVRKRPFDVGLIDQSLPDGLGIDLIRDIMRLRPFMGLAMYTARSDAGLLQSLQSLGVSYIAKPASRVGLGNAVHNAAAAVVMSEKINTRTLLIAEDIESVRDVLSRQLSLLGVKADFAATGQQALAMVKSGAYSALLTDIHMPDMNGYALAAAIRDLRLENESPFPVIALTADIQLSQRDVHMSYGFEECLLKPVSLNQMRRFLIRRNFLRPESDRAIGMQAVKIAARQKNSSSSIDRDAILLQMGAFDDDAIEMLKLFTSMTAPLMAQLQSCVDRGDIKALEEMAHSLKGAAHSACLTDLGDAAGALQAEAESGGTCVETAARVVLEFDKARQEIALL